MHTPFWWLERNTINPFSAVNIIHGMVPTDTSIRCVGRIWCWNCLKKCLFNNKMENQLKCVQLHHKIFVISWQVLYNLKVPIRNPETTTTINLPQNCRRYFHRDREWLKHVIGIFISVKFGTLAGKYSPLVGFLEGSNFSSRANQGSKHGSPWKVCGMGILQSTASPEEHL